MMRAKEVTHPRAIPLVNVWIRVDYKWFSWRPEPNKSMSNTAESGLAQNAGEHHSDDSRWSVPTDNAVPNLVLHSDSKLHISFDQGTLA
jgi:hypothetical protein